MRDVTSLVKFQNNDDEHLPITKCVCGKQFEPWSFIISIYEEDARKHHCENCGRAYFFRNEIRIYCVTEHP